MDAVQGICACCGSLSVVQEIAEVAARVCIDTRACEEVFEALALGGVWDNWMPKEAMHV